MIRALASKVYFFSLAAAAFTIPFYRGATNVALWFIVISWLIAYGIPNPKAILKLVGGNRIFIPVIGIYLLAVVGLTYSDYVQLGLKS